MQRIGFLIFIVLLSHSFLAQEDVYEDIAQEMCECISQHDTKLTPAFKDVLIRASLDMEHSDVIMSEYFVGNVEDGLKDATELVLFVEEMEGCMTALEEKYSTIYVSNANHEVEQKLLTILENTGHCEFTAAIVRIDISAGEEEEYYDEEK